MGEWRSGHWYTTPHSLCCNATGCERVGAIKGCLVAVHVRLAGAGQDCGTVGQQLACPAHVQGCGSAGCRMTLLHLTQARIAAAAAGHHLDSRWLMWLLCCVLTSPGPSSTEFFP